jgi:hypothetical protein
LGNFVVLAGAAKELFRQPLKKFNFAAEGGKIKF